MVLSSKMTLFLAVVVIICIFIEQPVLGQPEQIHLSYGVDPSRMVVTWSTLSFSMTSICYYDVVGKDPLKGLRATGFTSKFSDGHTQYIHKVTLDRLKPGTKYRYRCGDEKHMSDVFTFKSMKDGTSWVPRIAFFGDLGVKNDVSLGLLKQDVDKGMYDTILHIGDFAYNMETDYSYLGDRFMNYIQPIAANVPYMTAPGNHERASNFSNYKNRFTMPTDEIAEKMFYSFDIGPAHIISFSSEFYFFFQFGFEQMIRQYEWLEQDLMKAKKNRHIRPWIITMAHRPMYCSNRDHDDCTFTGSVIRNGLQFFGVRFWGLEELFFKYGVDLTLWAHEHSYERLWPLYNEEVRNGSLEEPYTNPDAPVHLITGSAGCYGKHDPFRNKSQIADWSAFRTTDYGYSRMEISNATHLRLQQVSIDQGGKIVDDIWLIKDEHQPYKDKNPGKGRQPVQYKDFLKIKDAFKFEDPVKDDIKVKKHLKIKDIFQTRESLRSNRFIKL